MKKIALFAALCSTALLAGCASTPEATQVAAADCKLQPMKTASPSYGKQKPVSDIERTQAVSDLSRSEARLTQLRGTMGQSGLYEELLRDCNR
jgi:hypothetical protein